MASFKGTNFIGEVEAKVAPIVEEYYLKNGARSFLVWLRDNNIKSVMWWDYTDRNDKEKYEAVPFNHYISIFREKEELTDVWDDSWNRWEHSLRYLLIPKEMALHILYLGYIA